MSRNEIPVLSFQSRKDGAKTAENIQKPCIQRPQNLPPIFPAERMPTTPTKNPATHGR